MPTVDPTRRFSDRVVRFIHDTRAFYGRLYE